MKKEIALKIENVSKQYRLGLTGTDTLSDDLNRWWHKIRGKEDPYATVGAVNDRSVEGGDYVWAIKDINIEVKKGEILGIIGKNGAGKSTLLKILSRITTPTTGEITVNGKISSLLEVGTGFHPELTGRENIFLNGAIMGMTKKEITSKLDDIVDFSGCAKYIDTPVKRYSSGMRVRLGFAVAAFLEPDILVVDEVLAVGDAEFQKKCIGKMKDIAGLGRTILFVSHNIQAVSNLCKTGVFLENGMISHQGSIEDCIKKYVASSRAISLETASLDDRLRRTGGDIIFTSIKPIKNGEESWEFNFDEEINIDFEITAQKPIENVLLYLAIRDPYTSEVITNYKKIIKKTHISIGEVIKFNISLPKRTLRPNEYSLYIALGESEAKVFYDVLDNNVNLPLLRINPTSMDVHENVGFVTAPFKLTLND